MRGFKLRLLSCAMLVALVAWAVQGQKVVPGLPGAPGGDPNKKEKDERSELDQNLPFAVPYDRDHKKRLEAVRDYLSHKPENIKWGDVCNFLQLILDSKSDSFFDVKYESGGKTLINRISVKTEANRIIATFSPEGLQFYQQLQGQNAVNLFEDAVKANYDLAMLSDLSQRYFHTKAGAQGAILLATIYLERGNYLEAAYTFERLMPRKDIDDYFTALTLFKACLSFKRSGDPKHAEFYKTTLAKLDAVAKNGVAIGRKTYTPDQIRTELERPIELLQKSDLVGEWTMRQGNAARVAVVDGGPPFLDPMWRNWLLPPDTPDNLEANNWIRGELDKLFVRDSKSTSKGAVPLSGMFPITTSEMLIYRGYDGLHAVSTRDRVINGRVVRAGELMWRSKATAGLHQMVNPGEGDDVDMKRDAQNWWNTYSSKSNNVSSILYENPLIGSLSHDGQNVYYVDDVAITPPPVFNSPEFGGMIGQQFRQSGDLADMVRAGKLVSVNMKTGSLAWDLGRVKLFDGAPPLPARLNEEEADKSTDAFRLCLDAVFLGAPMSLNGRLYVLIEQAGVIRLLCLDPKNLVQVPGQPRKPALIWSQKLGKPNNMLPQDSIRRYQGANLATSEGIIVCPTNAGVLVAVDIMSRSLLWAHGYRPVDNNVGRIQYDQNGMPIMPQQLKNDRYRSAGPIISNGRVITTAYDAISIDCLDLRTGKLLWSQPQDPNDLYVAGVANDRVIVVGKNYVRAYYLTGEEKSQRPKLAWEASGTPTPTGHGALSRDAFYLPVRQENAGKDTTTPAGEIWAIKLENGQIASKTAARKRNDTAELAKYGIGNLIFQDGMVYAQSAWEVSCYPQLGVKIAEMNKLLEKNPKDPVGLLSRGELNLDNGKLKDAVRDFKEAQKNSLPEEKLPQLREKLYIAYTELLRADFNTAEGFLEEYAGLCEIPSDPNEAPEDKTRREDEIKRRKRLHFYLLARGRETQGRLGEAFDNYLALANLGEGKQLLEMPDELNVKMRPDVWARGRIESMIRRATTEEAKKSLEVRVNKEWEEVKDGGDLKKLREFVTVFGPFFDSGREAQFKLADVLLSTKNEADSREAQTHLSQLRVTAEDPVIRARATEALAKLMIDNRMMEDAVALYLQLGKEYASIVIRDGKTGADFLNSLLTDKRLLPYLEPSRYPLPTRVKAEQSTTSSNNYQQHIELESPAELFPVFRQYRFVLDQYRGNGQSWTLIGYDRATGSERCRFPNLIIPHLYNNQGFPISYSKFVQGSGHIMLLQLGRWVYCFDLAEKKELWSKDLLGDSIPAFDPRRGNAYPPVDIAADGSYSVKFLNDGYVLSLGRSAIVQPGYIALLTHDGLECVEPGPGRRILWTRTGLSDRAQIHGDGRYIVVMDMEDNNYKPKTTKLLRAIDGMAIENAPDSGRVLAEAQSYKLLGRYALLSSGSDDQPRVLRLYDMATGKDVWKKEFKANSVPIQSPLNNEWAGFITPDGTAEIFSVRTGESVTKLKIDEKNLDAHLKPCVGAQLLADADRYYLVLDRDPNAAAPNGARPFPQNNYNMLRSQKVNGPIYAFDRANGKRLWHFADLLDHQSLILEQFADMPVIMAAAPVINANNTYSYPVVVIEKERGKLVFHKQLANNNFFFHNLSVDQKNGIISLIRPDLRITITADDTKK